MKCDMRAPKDGGTDYLLIIEGETQLEQTVLAQFARFQGPSSLQTNPQDGEELRIIFAAPISTPQFDAPAIKAMYLAWQPRTEYTKPAAAAEAGDTNGS